MFLHSTYHHLYRASHIIGMQMLSELIHSTNIPCIPANVPCSVSYGGRGVEQSTKLTTPFLHGPYILVRGFGWHTICYAVMNIMDREGGWESFSEETYEQRSEVCEVSRRRERAVSRRNS